MTKEEKNRVKSNNAHKRLSEKHGESYEKTGDLDHRMLQQYHYDVVRKQLNVRRKLSRSERKKIYKNNELFWTNPFEWARTK